MNKKIFSTMLAFTIVFSSVASLAAPFDFTNQIDPTKNYTFDQFEKSGTIFNEIAGSQEEYVIESIDGKLYNVKQVQDALDAGAKDFADAIKDLDPVDEDAEELEVIEISAINAKTLAVNFNNVVSAEDQAKATFDVKRGTIATTVEATWAEDGKSVELARATNLLAGTYTVTVGGLEFAEDSNFGTVEVKAQTATSIEIETNRVQDAAAQALEYVIYDQYEDEIKTPVTITALAYNVTKSANIGTIADVTNFDISSNVENGDVVRFTVFVSANPEVKAIKEVVVENINLASIEFGTPVLPEGATRFVPGLANVKVALTALDDAGEKYELTTGAVTANYEGMAWSFTNTGAVTVNAKGELLVTLGALAKPAVITVTNPVTGETKSVTINIEAVSAPNAVEFGESTIILSDAATYKLPVTFVDQYGEAIKAADMAAYTLSTNFNVSVVGPAGLAAPTAVSADGKSIVVAPTAKGTYTLTLTNLTSGAQSTTTVVVNEQRLPNELKVVEAPDATVANNGTTSVTFEVIDQYGKKMTSLPAGYSISASPTTGATGKKALATKDSAFVGTITGDATEIGKETLTFTLQKDAVVGSPAVAAVVIDTQAFEVEVIGSLTGLAVSVDKEEYTAGDDVAVTIKAEKGTNEAHTDYNKTDVAEVLIGGKTYLRTVTFVKGVATTTVPVETADVNPAVASITVKVTFDGQNDTTAAFKVKAAEASKLVLSTADVIVADEFGNIAKYNFTGIANVTNVAGTLTNVTPDAEGNVQLVITDGVVENTSGTAVTYAKGATASTLTLELSNGDVFAITLK